MNGLIVPEDFSAFDFTAAFLDAFKSGVHVRFCLIYLVCVDSWSWLQVQVQVQCMYGLLSHHVGLPGLLYVVCGDDDGDFPRPHDVHQMLPDPGEAEGRRRNQNKLHNTNKSFPKISGWKSSQLVPAAVCLPTV